jgi:hypothetical protein
MQVRTRSTWWLVLVAGTLVACGGASGAEDGAQPESDDASADVGRLDATQLPTDARHDGTTGHDASADAVAPQDASAEASAPDDANAHDVISSDRALVDVQIDGTFDVTTEVSSDASNTTADAQVETGPPADATSDFGKPCSAGSDCASGLCVKLADDSTVCTVPCTAGVCPTSDWRCGPPTAGGPDVCWPRGDFLCRPCESDADCRFTHEGQSTGDDAACVRNISKIGEIALDEGGFCGVSCDANRACPAGYDCTTVANSNIKQCVKSDHKCACRGNWVGLGYETSCSIAVTGTGTCTAKRECLAAGDPTDCGAATPSSEKCNGVDDNCDGNTDEGADALCPNDLLSCTTATCQGALGCGQVLAADSCLIDGSCYTVGAAGPAGPCDQCQPSTSSSGWTHIADACAIGNQCIPAGTVNPANPCEICDPLRSTTTYSPILDKCLIGGSCYDSNTTNPGNFCQVCQPATSRTTWTLKANTCFIAGQCYGAGATNGSLTCQICDPQASTSNFSINAGTCLINNTCYTSNQTNGSNVCQRCVPTTSKTQFTNSPASTVCQAGDTCYNDAHCASGSCPARTFIQDGNEINDTYVNATFTRTSNECDDQGATGSGVLSGSGDDDWFRVNFTENTTFCAVDPYITANTNGATAELCVYTKCSSGVNDGVDCQDGSSSSSALAGSGYVGCCKTGINPGFHPSHDCKQPCSGFLCIDGDDDSADVRVLVQNLSSTAACGSYSWSMHF